MSFDDAFEASKHHVIRYCGEAEDKFWLQRELFTILN